MKRVIFSKVMISILCAAAALAFSGFAAAQEKFYEAQPAGVPQWMEQGNFRYIRIDGGEIESLKAVRTWWGSKFNPTEIEVLTNIYGKYSDKMLKRLKEAHFNWIWVTWSNGWSLKKEEDNRKQLTDFIKRCHANGIKVTAYVSAVNMFWENMFIDNPESVTWLQIQNGGPVKYGGSPQRFLADTRIPGWRQYMLKKVRLAADAGADAIFYDNIIGDNEGLATLLTETQDVLTKFAAETKRPKPALYANTHMGMDRQFMNDICDLLWDEEGKDTPGVWKTGWETGNVRKIKFLNGSKQTWQPLKYEYDLYHCGPRETCIPFPEEQKLIIAEEYAFGAAASKNIEGAFLKALMKDEKPALEAWKAIGLYNKFIMDNSKLYNRVTPRSKIAVMVDADESPLSDVLIKRNIQFQNKVWGRPWGGQPLSSFEVLAMPIQPVSVSAEQEKALRDFAAGGGKIFAANPSSAGRSWNASASKKDTEKIAKLYKELGVETIPSGVVSNIQRGGDISAFVGQIVAAAGGPDVTLEGAKYVLMNVTKDREGSILVHLMNYDFAKPAENLTLKVNLSDEEIDRAVAVVCATRIFSPDSKESFLESPIVDKSCTYKIKSLKRYQVLKITPMD